MNGLDFDDDSKSRHPLRADPAVVALLGEDWKVAKSGVSVDAGATRIRQERSGSEDELRARAALLSTAPTGFQVALLVLDIDNSLEEYVKNPSAVELDPRRWTELVALARRAFEKGRRQ